MNRLLKLGNIIFGLSAIVMLWNSIEFYFTNIFYESISLQSKVGILIILFLLILAYLFYFKKNLEKFENRQSCYSFKMLLFVVMIIWQILLLVSMPIVPIADPRVVYHIAIGDISTELVDYISTYPNNYVLLLWEKALILIFGKKYLIHGFILFNIIFIDCAILILTYLSSKKSIIQANILFYFLVLFIGFSPQFLQAYTDCPSFFLGTLILLLGYKLSNQESFLKQIFLALTFGGVAAISYGMRAPLAIYVISGLIVLIVMFTQKTLMLSVKKILVALTIVLSFLGIIKLNQYSLQQQHFVPFEEGRSRTLLYFIDLGLTSSGATHAELTEEVLNATGDERNKIFINSIKTRLSKMKINDFIDHLKVKFAKISSEGMMGWQVESTLLEDNLIPNRWTSSGIARTLRKTVLVNFTDYFRISFLYQIFWIIIILGVVLYSFFSFKVTANLDLWSQITFFGGLLFLMIFEGGRSRYLIQFLPAIVWISSLGYARFIWRKKPNAVFNEE